jgi:ribosomal protein S12 methylthiotransferase accessory factor
MDVRISFPGGKRVEAECGSHVIKTDQSPAHGGEGSAPEPFDLFLASIGACAGAYVLGFCQARSIPIAGLSIAQRNFFDDTSGHLQRVSLEIALPPSFPERYRAPLARAVESCRVKRALHLPPEVSVATIAASDPPHDEGPVPT